MFFYQKLYLHFAYYEPTFIRVGEIWDVCESLVEYFLQRTSPCRFIVILVLECRWVLMNVCLSWFLSVTPVSSRYIVTLYFIEHCSWCLYVSSLALHTLLTQFVVTKNPFLDLFEFTPHIMRSRNITFSSVLNLQFFAFTRIFVTHQ